MSTLTKHNRLLGEAAVAAKAAREIAEKADTESREMTEAERKDFDAHFARATELKSQADVAKKDQDVLDQAKAIADLVGDGDLVEGMKGDLDAQAQEAARESLKKTLGRTIVDSAEFKAAMAPFKSADGSVRVPKGSHFSADPIGVKSFIRTKSLFTGGSDTSGGAFVVNDRTDILELLGRRDLRLRDLVSVRSTGGDTVEYVEQTSHTNSAAETAEATSSAAPTQDGSTGALIKNAGGGYKPEGAWAFAVRTAVVKTIAEWVPATKRALADAGQLEGLINDELRKDIEEREDSQIIAGSGSGENITGILNWSGIQTQAFSSDLFTSVRKGITKAKTVGRVNPTGIVMSPADVEQVDLAQDANDRYFGNGPFSMGPRTLWGVPIVESEAISDGTALLGDFSKAVLWDREQTTVTMTDSHEDFFVRNLVAILAEERVAFAVTRPKAFVSVDVTA